MDWRLPGIDGLETSRRIKANPIFSLMPELLMVSAFEREEVFAGHLDSAFDGFLSKPVSEKQLMDAIAGVFEPDPESGGPGSASDTRQSPPRCWRELASCWLRIMRSIAFLLRNC